MSVDRAESQQSFLHGAKATLGLTWDALADAAGIEPRAFKNYRMPDDSTNHRRMPKLAWRSIEYLLAENEKINRKKKT